MATVRLKREEEKRIKAGHPWVYRTEIEDIYGSFQPGDIVEVEDYWGKFIGRGYINPASMITIRLLTCERAEEINEAFWRRRLSSAWNYRQKVLQGADTDSCRVVFGGRISCPG